MLTGMRRYLPLIAAILVFASCSAAATRVPATVPPTVPPTLAPASAPPTHTLVGSLTVSGDQYGSARRGAVLANGNCEPSPGYKDLMAGLPVTVTDAAGVIIATGVLANDTQALTEDPLPHCHLVFRIAALPETLFYQVTIGQRKAPTYSLAQLVAAAWQVLLTLGPY
jgi:hypothetical protein